MAVGVLALEQQCIATDAVGGGNMPFANGSSPGTRAKNLFTSVVHKFDHENRRYTVAFSSEPCPEATPASLGPSTHAPLALVEPKHNPTADSMERGGRYTVVQHTVDFDNCTIKDELTDDAPVSFRRTSQTWRVIERLVLSPRAGFDVADYEEISGTTSQGDSSLRSMKAKIKNKIFHGRVELSRGSSFTLLSAVTPVRATESTQNDPKEA
jgi:hypothetical protein